VKKTNIADVLLN